MKRFDTSLGKYNIYIRASKSKIHNSFIFDVFPFIEIHHARYENNINLNIFLGWLFYSISVEFEKYDD